MRFIPTDKPRIRKRNGEMQDILHDVLPIGCDCVEVEWRGEYATAESCRNSIQRCITENHFNLQVRVLKGHLYLIKK